MALVIGEITTNCYVDIPKTVRNVINDIGYTKGEYGFDGNTCNVLTAIDEQSSDIAQGVDEALEYKTGELAQTEEDIIEATLSLIHIYLLPRFPETLSTVLGR